MSGLTSSPVDAQPAPTVPSPVAGFWLGTLKVAGQSLRLQVTVETDTAGHELCTVDSLDQGALGLSCANVSYPQRSFSFDVPSVKGRWAGKLSDDGKSLSGDWIQRTTLPLDFVRQDKPVSPPQRPPVTFSPAMAPVDAADMQAILDRDFEQALKSGTLAPQTAAGVTIGVLRKGVRRVFSYGTAKPDSIFEIGSVTKTFTGLILAQMIEQGKARLDQPVRELLPAGTISKPDGQDISLLDLVTQHSGLPRLPDNFNPAHEPRNTALPGMHIAFAWLQGDSSGTYWHNGGTGGYSSFVFFNVREDYAGVVLVNRSVGTQGSLADSIGQHIGQRFAGRPALSLDASD